MKKNVGSRESNIRMVAGAVIVLYALFIVEAPTVKIVLATVAAILAGTALIHFCPINLALKRDSSDTESTPEKANGDEETEETEEEGDSEKVDE